MRKKELSLIVAFDETAQAMGAERCFQDRGLPGRLIPIPREITAGCGLAWKAAPQDQQCLKEALEALSLGNCRFYVLEV